jgi:hypothetical protein
LNPEKNLLAASKKAKMKTFVKEDKQKTPQRSSRYTHTQIPPPVAWKHKTSTKERKALKAEEDAREGNKKHYFNERFQDGYLLVHTQ